MIVSILIDPDFLKKIVKMARPIAASAAATTKTNKANICPKRSFKVLENPIKFIFVASNINSMDIRIEIIFFLFINIPKKPIEKIIDDNIR